MEAYVKILGLLRYVHRAIGKHSNPVDFLLTAKRDLNAARPFFRKILQSTLLLSPDKIRTDEANTFPRAIEGSVYYGLLVPDPIQYVTKHLQQDIEGRLKKSMLTAGGLRSFNSARKTFTGFEAMLWLKKGLDFANQ